MSDTAGPRKPLHPFVKFVAIVVVVIVVLDVAIAILTNDQTVGLPGSQNLGLRLLIGAWISDAAQILLQVAYLIGLAVVIELVDRILWRLTPEAERRVGRSPRAA
jgi:hypothetical protein